MLNSDMSGADANAALGHYQKVISYLIGVLLKNGCSHAHTVGRAFIMQPEEYDTPRVALTRRR